MRTTEGGRRSTRERAALVAVLAAYWTTVFPAVRTELARWRALASQLPDARTRQLALSTLDDEGGLAEGAAIFATLVPAAAARRPLVTLLVAWQVAYDYLDTLGEQIPAACGPDETADRYAVLVSALDPRPGDDACARVGDEYLAALLACCRARVAALPSIGAVGDAVLRAARRCAEAQALTHAVLADGTGPLRAWALAQPQAEGFLWWEVAAGAISSLGVHALLAAAARPHATAAGAARIDAAYFPSICALSTLLDSTIDAADDAGTANHRCTAYYADPAQELARLEQVARTAASAARGLPQGRGHAVILAGMAAYYAAAGWDGNERVHRRVAAAGDLGTGPIAWSLRVRARLRGSATPAVSAVGGTERRRRAR